MDRVLHAERLDGKFKRLHWRKIDGLPDGTTIVVDDSSVALRGKRLLRWTPRGYNGTIRRPRGVDVAVLTPPSILAVLAARLPAIVASERGLNPQGGSIGVTASAAGTPWAQANSTMAVMIASMAATRATQAGQPASVQASPPSAAPKLPPT